MPSRGTDRRDGATGRTPAAAFARPLDTRRSDWGGLRVPHALSEPPEDEPGGRGASRWKGHGSRETSDALEAAAPAEGLKGVDGGVRRAARTGPRGRPGRHLVLPSEIRADEVRTGSRLERRARGRTGSPRAADERASVGRAGGTGSAGPGGPKAAVDGRAGRTGFPRPGQGHRAVHGPRAAGRRPGGPDRVTWSGQKQWPKGGRPADGRSGQGRLVRSKDRGAARVAAQSGRGHGPRAQEMGPVAFEHLRPGPGASLPQPGGSLTTGGRSSTSGRPVPLWDEPASSLAWPESRRDELTGVT